MNLQAEGLLTLPEARPLFRSRGGKHPKVRTLIDRIKAGLLEGVKDGGVWYTSAAAVERYVERKQAPVSVPVVRSKSQRERESAAAREELLKRCGKWPKGAGAARSRAKGT